MFMCAYVSAFTYSQDADIPHPSVSVAKIVVCRVPDFVPTEKRLLQSVVLCMPYRKRVLVEASLDQSTQHVSSG